MEVKPKRKYTKKTKSVKFEEPLSRPNSPEVEEKQIDEISNKLKDIFVKGYDEIALYIYHEGSKIDTLRYIKDFQTIVDKHGLGSQVVIYSKRHIEKIGLFNCYTTEDCPKKWTDMCLSKNPVLAINIKERPKISPEELFELIKKETVYNDDFIEFYEY